LVYTGAKLVNLRVLRDLARHGRGEIVIYAGTVATIVSVDLLLGVLVGLGLAGIKLLHSLSGLSITTEPDRGTGAVVMSLRGAATFLRLPVLSSALETLPPRSKVVLRSHELHWLDQACIKHLEAWKRRHLSRGGQVQAAGRLQWPEV
jgi:MFS superfamily sulfate permease-like transporter